jgi:hypothetical protein
LCISLFLQNEPYFRSSLQPLASLSGVAGIGRDCNAVGYSAMIARHLNEPKLIANERRGIDWEQINESS